MEPLSAMRPRTAPTVRRGRARNFLAKTTILAGMADYFAEFFRQSSIPPFSKAPKMSPSGECPFPGTLRCQHVELRYLERAGAQECRQRSEGDIFVGPEAAPNCRPSQIPPKSCYCSAGRSADSANVVDFRASKPS